MAAKIGILGESTVGTVGVTTTVYTVPADKASRIRVLWVVEAHSSTKYQFNVKIGSPGTENTIHIPAAATQDMWTGINAQATPDPALSFTSDNIGVQIEADQVYLTTNTNQPQMWWITPLPHDYYLATGDTVQIHVAEALPTDFLFQVHGVEDDA